MSPSLAARCLAELTGTSLLVGIGTGSIVAGANVGGVPQWVLAVAWFAAVAVPIQAFAFVSGAHLNPGVTMALAGARRFPPAEALPFVSAQIAGAFVGSATVKLLFGGAAHLGATVPGPAGPEWVVPLEFAFTFLLVLSVLRLADLGRKPRRLELLAPAMIVGVATFLIGPWTGSSLNFARSLAPAVLSDDFAWLWLYAIGLAIAPIAAVAVDGLLPRPHRLRPGAADGSDMPAGPASEPMPSR